MKNMLRQIESAWHYFWQQWRDTLPRPVGERLRMAVLAGWAGWIVWNQRGLAARIARRWMRMG